jgi:hypothetical protein
MSICVFSAKTQCKGWITPNESHDFFFKFSALGGVCFTLERQYQTSFSNVDMFIFVLVSVFEIHKIFALP